MIECRVRPLPVGPAVLPLADGRSGKPANNIYGTVYSRVDGRRKPVAQYAGYAPFGFGYRGCAG